MTINKIFKIIMLLLLHGSSMVSFSQEWQHKIMIDSLEYYHRFQIRQLSNGNFLSPAAHVLRESTQEPWYTESPAVILISEDGEDLARNNFFRPGYCTISYSCTFEKGDYYYLLTTYSPEHFPGSFNHFENYDNPPSDAKLSLLKLDKELNLVESYDHSWPIDTYEDHGGSWEIYPNGFSGNIYLFTAFEEDDNIVGAYWKSVSFDNPSRGDDTLFFFRMNFDGKILNRKAVDVLEGKSSADTRGLRVNRYRGDHFVATDSCYIFYRIGNTTNGTNASACAEYYDKDFNFIKERYLVPDYIPGYGDYDLRNITVRRSNHNTTYLSTQIRSYENPQHDEDVRLYEINDDVNSTLPYLEKVKYIDRGTEEWDHTSLLSSVDLIDDSTLCYVTELYCGFYTSLDSWIVIEHLDYNLDTISTLYYGVDNGMSENLYDILRTKDGGVVIVHGSSSLYEDYAYYVVTKFPASAFGFVNIEEAHAHGLKVAVAYPNPGRDVMNIRTGLRNATLQVYDMQGRKVHEQEVTEEVTSIDASKWSSGTYVWELRAGNGNGSGNGNGNENGILESGKWVK